MITGPLTKAAAEDIERALRVLEEDEDEGWGLWNELSPETQKELEKPLFKSLHRLFCIWLSYLMTKYHQSLRHVFVSTVMTWSSRH